MKVSLPHFCRRVGGEGGGLAIGLPSRVVARASPVFQEGAGTLYDSHDRDKAVSLSLSVTVEDAGNGFFGENRFPFIGKKVLGRKLSPLSVI